MIQQLFSAQQIYTLICALQLLCSMQRQRNVELFFLFSILCLSFDRNFSRLHVAQSRKQLTEKTAEMQCERKIYKRKAVIYLNTWLEVVGSGCSV